MTGIFRKIIGIVFSGSKGEYSRTREAFEASTLASYQFLGHGWDGSKETR